MGKRRCNKNTMMSALVVVLGLCVVYLMYTQKTTVEGMTFGQNPCAPYTTKEECNKGISINLAPGQICGWDSGAKKCYPVDAPVRK